MCVCVDDQIFPRKLGFLACFLTVYFPSRSLFPQEMCGEVEVLMERMKQLQECRDDEEASQEEMATRFEREKTESMLVVTAEDDECVPSRDISRHFEDPSYGYKDFSRRGEHVPTFRVQVEIGHKEICTVEGSPDR